MNVERRYCNCRVGKCERLGSKDECVYEFAKSFDVLNIDFLMPERVDNLEFRWSDCNKKYELIRWFKFEDTDPRESCLVIMFFDEGSEGYNFRSVGDRPFDSSIDEETFWGLMWESMEYLKKIFRKDHSDD